MGRFNTYNPIHHKENKEGNSYNPFVIWPVGPPLHCFYSEISCTTLHWSYDPLFLLLTGPMPHRASHRLDPRWCMAHWSYELFFLRINSQTGHWSYKSEPRCCTAHWSYEPLVLRSVSPPIGPRWHITHSQYRYTTDKICNIWKTKWKHAYLTFWFDGNGLAPNIIKYCEFNVTLWRVALWRKMHLTMFDIKDT